MAAVAPKLPSIWKIQELPDGCVSNRLGPVLCWSSRQTDSQAFSPSSSLARKSIAHARLQPVYAPPALGRELQSRPGMGRG